MASLASLVSLGSAGAYSSSTSFEVSLSLVRRVSVPQSCCSCSFRRLGGWRRALVCRFSMVKDFVSEKGNVATPQNSLSGVSKDGDSGLLLRPSPRPLMRPEPWLNSRTGGNSVSSDSELRNEGEKKVIDPLSEALEKVEKFETPKPEMWVRRDGGTVNKAISSPRNGRAVNTSVGDNTKASKGVWRKGNPVTEVRKVTQEPVRIDEVRKAVGSARLDEKLEPEKSASAPVASAPMPPLPPSSTDGIKLQSKPSLRPPTVRPKRAVILKDVGAAPKLQETDENGADVAAVTERAPILVDKYSRKKAATGSQTAQEPVTHRRPAKPSSAKYDDDDFLKKNASFRRRMNDDDVELPDEISELGVRIPGAAPARRRRKWSKASRKAAKLQAAMDVEPEKVDILEVDEKGMLISELAYNLAIGEGEIYSFLFTKSVVTGKVETLDKHLVKMVCAEYDVEVLDATPVKLENRARKKQFLDENDLDKLEERPPVITIMGHVDHGKTTLLDHIRKSKVVASEAGGITQGIGAYKVSVPVDGKLQPCVFLDTPGHEAFGAMRARGARVTDIAIIVVAADDGIRPQTNEAIAHAKAAEVPIVVAINKIDKDGANADSVMQELSSIGLMPEDWGGDVPMVQISALNGDNVDDLLETVMLVAELQELKANPHRNAKGTVIEAALHKLKGPIATFIVQNGTLRRGNIVVSGEAFGKVRALFDDGGKNVNEAGPSTPVQIIGLNTVPFAGDEFEVVSSLDIAREKAEARAEAIKNERQQAIDREAIVTLSALASAISAQDDSAVDLHQLNIILRVDVQVGSIEAIRQALQILPQDNVTLKFLLEAAGDVTMSDVDLAFTSKAIILGFNVKAPGPVQHYAGEKGIEIRLYRVIYDLIDDVRNAMEGLLQPAQEQVPIGAAEVLAIFSSRSTSVAGCMVKEGKLAKGCDIRVVRDGKVIHTGVLNSLRRVKEDVKEVSAGLECGVGLDDYDDFKVGDIVEAFKTVQKKRTLEDASATIAAVLDKAGISR
ncbi:Translation initiation factor IF-2, chloroplastic-like protein [Drosera capensis]